MKIKVEQSDIDGGARCNGNHCPIALAIKRAIKSDDVCVGVIDGRIGLREILLPPAAIDFVAQFDLGKDVTPFEFEISLDGVIYDS